MEVENKTEEEIAKERMINIALGREIVESRQDFKKAIIFGALAALACSVAWYVITVVTEYQIGYMSVGVGAAIAFTIRSQGLGLDLKYSILAAALSIASCLLGNILIVSHYIADEYQVYFIDALLTYFLNFLEFFTSTFQGIDVLFYGLAFYIAFKYSIFSYTTEELEAIAISSKETTNKYSQQDAAKDAAPLL